MPPSGPMKNVLFWEFAKKIAGQLKIKSDLGLAIPLIYQMTTGSLVELHVQDLIGFEAACSNCGRELPLDHKFCQQCGIRR